MCDHDHDHLTSIRTKRMLCVLMSNFSIPICQFQSITMMLTHFPMRAATRRIGWAVAQAANSTGGATWRWAPRPRQGAMEWPLKGWGPGRGLGASLIPGHARSVLPLTCRKENVWPSRTHTHIHMHGPLAGCWLRHSHTRPPSTEGMWSDVYVQGGSIPHIHYMQPATPTPGHAHPCWRQLLAIGSFYYLIETKYVTKCI